MEEEEEEKKKKEEVIILADDNRVNTGVPGGTYQSSVPFRSNRV